MFVYERNYLSCQEKLGKGSVIMETKGKGRKRRRIELPTIQHEDEHGRGEERRRTRCGFEDYDFLLVTR